MPALTSSRIIRAKPYLPGDPAFTGDLLSFLASSGDSGAYTALAEGLGEQSPGIRLQVIAAFLGGRARETIAFGAQGGGSRAPTPADVDPAAQGVLEDLLGARLGDDVEVSGVYMMIDGVDVDMRLGHVAARALAASFPEKYRYDAKAGLAVRDAQRMAAENQWRKARGLAPVVPAPPRPRPAPVTPEIAGPAMDAVLTAMDEDARTKAATALEGLGLGALPEIVGRLRGIKEGAEGRSALERAAGRIASIVSEVVVVKGTVAPDPAYGAVLEGLRGKPFDADAFVRLVLGVTNGAPNGATGLRLRIVRDGDLAGAVVAVTLVENRARSGTQWDQSGPSISIDGRRGGMKSAAMAIDHG